VDAENTPIGTLNFPITSLFLTLPFWEENLGGYPALNSGGKRAAQPLKRCLRLRTSTLSITKESSWQPPDPQKQRGANGSGLP
jgi:hypothetical protein